MFSPCALVWASSQDGRSLRILECQVNAPKSRAGSCHAFMSQPQKSEWLCMLLVNLVAKTWLNSRWRDYRLSLSTGEKESSGKSMWDREKMLQSVWEHAIYFVHIVILISWPRPYVPGLELSKYILNGWINDCWAKITLVPNIWANSFSLSNPHCQSAACLTGSCRSRTCSFYWP